MEKRHNFMSKFADLDANALKHLTSRQFFEVWNNYDQDGNGFIEGRELDNFLREFVTSIRNETEKSAIHSFLQGSNQILKEPLDEELLQELKRAFLDAYDNNRDGRIDIRELAQLLPLEESFKLLFKFENQVDSSVEFMRIWTKYDTDSSGFIDAQELRSFLKDLIQTHQESQTARGRKQPLSSAQSLDQDKLDEYTETLLKIFDANKDGKLQLSEMTKLLLVKENFLFCCGIFGDSTKRLDKSDVERIFNSYDRDANGVIENEELKGFIKDLMDFLGKAPDTKDIEEFERMVMEGCDANGDGKINKRELTTVLMALAKHASDEAARKTASQPTQVD